MEITDEIRIKALNWFRELDPIKRFELKIKHCNSTSITADQAVSIWRRTTGGEWAYLLRP